MAKWPTVPNFFMALIEKKKLKSQKITKHKTQKYCKDPVEDMYKKNLKCLAATVSSALWPTVLNIFFKFSMRERKKTKNFKKIY